MTIVRTAAAAALVAAFFLPGTPLLAQERPDTVPRPDTVAVPDSVPAPDPAAARDTLQAPDSAAVDAEAADPGAADPEPERPDTVQAVPDSLVFHTLPTLRDGAPEGFERGVWTWDRAELMSARGQTLLELLETVPGVVALRGGDYGSPEAFSAFGVGGGRVRVFLDGFEILPLDGAVVDLSRVALVGLESVRVERGMGEVRIDLEGLVAKQPRPMSIVEAGTGDFDTNHFRGTFIHPKALGGSLALGMERIDTQGPGGAEEGSRQGWWLRYARHFGDRGGVQAEYRSASSEIALDSVAYPTDISRSDWIVRARYRLTDALVAEAFTGRSSIAGPEEDDGLTPIEGDRAQHGLRASWEEGPVWATASARLLSGPDLPSTSLAVEGGGTLPELGGASARWSRETWDGRGTTLLGLKAWTRSVWGLSGFASYETGERGARNFDPRVEVPDPVDDPDDQSDDTGDAAQVAEAPTPAFRVTDRTGLRAGATFAWGPVSVSGAWLRLEADSLLPFDLHSDRDGAVLPGGEFTGWEVSGRVDVPFTEGFYLYGATQQWDDDHRYLPKRTYQGGLAFHDVFLESENFELWADLGVQGRDPMFVPVDPTDDDFPLPVYERVPFYQSWNAFIEARIVTVHIIIRWDNFAIRRNNQDFPGRVQPITRATYGIRWTLWN